MVLNFQSCRVIASSLAAGAFLLFSGQSAVQAQTCGADYVVAPGDSLSLIASRVYEDGQLWSAIYYSNQQTLGTDPSLIYPGMQIRIPCLSGSELETVKVRSKEAQKAAISKPVPASDPALDLVEFVTAGDYEPFTDQKLPNGGVFTELVSAALDKYSSSHGGPKAEIVWVNDWSSHLTPLVLKKKFDAGFPWFRPECEDAANLDDDAKFRCDNFNFSEPVVPTSHPDVCKIGFRFLVPIGRRDCWQKHLPPGRLLRVRFRSRWTQVVGG